MSSVRGQEIEFDIVVAADLGEGIGHRGQLPWHLPADLAHLKRLTTETEVPGATNAVVMGRVTWDTIPERWRPLPRRFNVIVTRQVNLAVPEGAARSSSFVRALEVARARVDVERIFVLGGGEIYRQAIGMPRCRRIYLTRVLRRYECDAHFPTIPSRFRREALLGEGAEGEGADRVGYRIELWTRTS